MVDKATWLARICLVVILCLAVFGCAPSIKREGYIVTPSEKDIDCKVTVTKQEDFHAEQTKLLGTMKIGDSGFSAHCGEAEALKILRAEACKLGAQVIVLRDIKLPGIMSSCYRVTADFVSLSDTTAMQDSLMSQQVSEVASPKKGNGMVVLQVLAYAVGAVAGFWLGYTLFK